jgi:transposase
MYVDQSTTHVKDKNYTRTLLRESYREDGEVKHRTVANISKCSDEEIEAIKLALKHKDDLSELVSVSEDISLHQGPSVAAVWALYQLAGRLGIVDGLGRSREGKLALWQIMARVIDQGSRLSAVRLASRHTCCDVLNLDSFNEEDLYSNLDWLCEHQGKIEAWLFKKQHPDGGTGLFLYDVTSSYLEGVHNELGFFGYNRDGKRGKKQVVVGLLCDGDGVPLSVEVFEGNTADTRTFGSQVKKAADRFGGGEVTFVGDRGMIRSRQIEDLQGHGFHYITAITKPQIERLLREDVLQMELFDEEVAEVRGSDGLRYVLRRNPLRAKEVSASREDKLRNLLAEVGKCNRYLAEHRRAKLSVALRKLKEYAQKRKISDWIVLAVEGRTISVHIDEPALAEASKLDGCYVIKTDLSARAADKQTVHDRYKDLSLVEQAFKTCKTEHLELRPINVRLASRTRGHAFVVMLAYRLRQELARYWRDLDLTVAEGITELTSVCTIEIYVKGTPRSHRIPTPRDLAGQLLRAAQVRLPKALPNRGVIVTTKKKLPTRRVKA